MVGMGVMTGDIAATGSEVANDTILEARFEEEELVFRGGSHCVLHRDFNMR